MKMKFLDNAFLRGEFVNFNEANVSIATHALHYGTAAFAGVRGWVDSSNASQTIVFRLSDHMKRFARSAKLLGVDINPLEVETKIIELVRLNQPTKPIYIRPLIYTSDLGIAPRLHDVETDLLIYMIEMGDYLPPDGVSVCFSSWTKAPDVSIPARGKLSGTYINSSLAKSEAIDRGFDEAIVLSTNGKVAEASAMNIFIVRDGVLFTPGVDQDILEGITRQSIIEVAKDMRLKVVERPVDKSELYIADEVFLCGSAAKITPVKKVESTKLPEQRPITHQLMEKLDLITQNKDSRYKDWITVIDY